MTESIIGYNKDGNKVVVTIGVLEFIRKITQHIAPKGFRTVRRCGFILFRRKENRRRFILG